MLIPSLPFPHLSSCCVTLVRDPALTGNRECSSYSCSSLGAPQPRGWPGALPMPPDGCPGPYLCLPVAAGALPMPPEEVPSLKSAESSHSLHPVETELQTPLLALIYNTKPTYGPEDSCPGLSSSTWRKLEFFGRREPQLKKCLHQTGLRTSMWDIFLIANR